MVGLQIHGDAEGNGHAETQQVHQDVQWPLYMQG